MKHLKMSMYLLLIAVIFTSCEKETTMLPENAEMNEQGTAPFVQPIPNSISEIIKSGIDLEAYFNSRPKIENTGARPAYSQIRSSNLQFFYSSEDLPCNSLPTEDFEEATNYSGSLPNYLNENSDNDIFSPGDILPGISFEVTLSNESSEQEFDYESHNEDAFYIWTTSYWNAQKVLIANYHETDLTINFSGSNVTMVSMDLYNWNYIHQIIEVYDLSGNLIGSDYVYVQVGAKFWAVQSLAPISKIVIKSQNQYGFEGVDNVSFGNCNDMDSDGVLNENDLCSNTPYGEEVNSNGCAQSQFDDDNDGVTNGYDDCSNTPIGETVNENGCGQSQLDYDHDGVMNNKDLHIYSDFRLYMNIAGNHTNIKNKMVKNGSTMMDQLNDLIAETNSQYTGQNYTYLHKRFMTKLAQLTYEWGAARLITATQRTKISSIAWGATIPYNNYS